MSFHLVTQKTTPDSPEESAHAEFSFSAPAEILAVQPFQISSHDLRTSWREDRNAVVVSTADFKISEHFVYSEGFSRCQALVMWDPISGQGALGHFNPQTDPEFLLAGHTYGPFGGFCRNVPIAREVFSDPSNVCLAHIFGLAHSFPEIWVEKALEREGFTRPIAHIKVDSTCWRDVGLDARTGIITVLRSDEEFPTLIKLFDTPSA